MRGPGPLVVALCLLLAGCPTSEQKFDQDGDGWEDAQDCAPGDAAVHPEADDPVGDGVDADCDGTDGLDADGDGFAAAPDGTDCNDGDPMVHPDATEVPDDNKDNDCVGGDLVCDIDGDGAPSDHPLCGGSDCDDTDGACWTPTDCLDEDGDGVRLCHGDCDDADPDRAPGQDEVCDGKDNDCNAEVPANEADADGDGLRVCEEDCDDGDATVHPGADELCDGLDTDCEPATEHPDGDGDTDDDGDPDCSDCEPDDEAFHSLDADGDGWDLCQDDDEDQLDCDDGASTSFPGAPDVPTDGVDANCDGTPGVDGDGDGYADLYEDCDDEDDAIHPGATESCDGIDQDCDGVPSALNMGDEEDADGDGFLACAECDDGDAAVHPGAVEDDCDGVDTDCDGVLAPGDVDDDGDGDLACTDCDDTDPTLNTLDLDGDTWDRCLDPADPSDALDCDDLQTSWNPAVTDIAGDDFDQNCDGVDGLDADQDGWASSPSGGEDCDDDDPVLNRDDADNDLLDSCDGDCDDFDPLNFAGNVEVCDLQDNDCDAEVDEDGEDLDGDGQGCWDCDDSDPSIHAGAPEGCDLVDTDCDGGLPAEEADEDGDGVATCEGDCDDADPNNFPGNLEACDVQDNDCDGEVDEGTDTDGDGDGWYECQGDCDDTDVENFPFSPELCDGQDNDCDGVVPLADQDADGDGYAPCEGDCDDSEAWSNPGATEIVDGLDNDCDGSVDLGAVICDRTVPLDHPTIQDAVDAAADGDVVCVEPGLWPDVVLIGESDPVVELRGLAGPGMTTLEGDGEIFRAYQEIVVAGLGIAEPTGGNTQVSIETPQPVVVEHVWVSGALVRFWYGLVTAHRLRLVDAILNLDRGVQFVADGLVVDGGLGPSVMDGASLDCTNCLLTGAILSGIACSGGGSVALVDSVVSSAGSAGVWSMSACSEIELVGTLVAANQSSGIRVDCALTLDHCAILKNYGFTGGGVKVSSASETFDFSMTSSVVALNDVDPAASFGTDGLYLAQYSNPFTWTVQDNVLWDDATEVYPTDVPIVGVDGNFAADPLFLGDLSHPNPLRWDLHLDPSSPLVDVGPDLDPDGSPGDIGLYGGPDAGGFDLDGDGWPEWWQPGPYDSVTLPALGWDCDDGDASAVPGNGC
jgi:hypothetical protein